MKGVPYNRANVSLESDFSGAYTSMLFSQRIDREEWDGSNPKHSEAIEKSDLVIAGCSFTTTVGVEYEKLWGTQLAELLGVSYVNISRIGWSMGAIVSNLLLHLHTRKTKPKYIAVLATELFRFITPVNPAGTNSVHYAVSRPSIVNANLTHREDMTVPVKYSKRPHLVEDVVSLDAVFYQSLSAITQLIQYCKASDIKLVWGTWDSTSSEFYREIMQSPDGQLTVDLGNYIELPTYHSGDRRDNLPADCHLNDRKRYGDAHHCGTDGGTHAGVHYHSHWAEDFYDSLKINN
jgi:hypothetical protein